jgi:hypothetical protein
MTLGIRRLIVLALVAAIFLLANVWIVVTWLDEKGMIDFAEHIRTEYLTGTAIAIIIVLLILLVRPGAAGRRCAVCERRVAGRARYCGECGSRV